MKNIDENNLLEVDFNFDNQQDSQPTTKHPSFHEFTEATPFVTSNYNSDEQSTNIRMLQKSNPDVNKQSKSSGGNSNSQINFDISESNLGYSKSHQEVEEDHVLNVLNRQYKDSDLVPIEELANESHSEIDQDKNLHEYRAQNKKLQSKVSSASSPKNSNQQNSSEKGHNGGLAMEPIDNKMLLKSQDSLRRMNNSNQSNKSGKYMFDTIESIKNKLNANKIKLNSMRSNDSKNFSPTSKGIVSNTSSSEKKAPKTNYSPEYQKGEVEEKLAVPMMTKKKGFSPNINIDQDLDEMLTKSISQATEYEKRQKKKDDVILESDEQANLNSLSSKESGLVSLQMLNMNKSQESSNYQSKLIDKDKVYFEKSQESSTNSKLKDRTNNFDNKGLSSQIKAFEGKFDALESKQTKVMFENNALKVEVNKYKEDNSQLNIYIQDLKKDISFLEEKYESKMTDEHEKNTSLMKGFKSSQNQTMDQMKKRQESEILDLQAKNQLLESKFKTYKDESQRKQEHAKVKLVSELEQLKKYVTTDKEKMNSDLQKQKQSNVKLKDKIKHQDQMIKKSSTQSEDEIGKILSESTTKLENQAKLVSMLKTDNDTLKKKIALLQKDDKVTELSQQLEEKNKEIEKSEDSFMKLQKRLEGMEEKMIKYNNIKASLEQLQMNQDAIKKTTKSENIIKFQEEYNQMLTDLKIYEERLHTLEESLVQKDNTINDLNNKLEESNMLILSKERTTVGSLEKATYDNLYSFGNYRDNTEAVNSTDNIEPILEEQDHEIPKNNIPKKNKSNLKLNLPESKEIGTETDRSWTSKLKIMDNQVTDDDSILNKESSRYISRLEYGNTTTQRTAGKKQRSASQDKNYNQSVDKTNNSLSWNNTNTMDLNNMDSNEKMKRMEMQLRKLEVENDSLRHTSQKGMEKIKELNRLFNFERVHLNNSPAENKTKISELEKKVDYYQKLFSKNVYEDIAEDSLRNLDNKVDTISKDFNARMMLKTKNDKSSESKVSEDDTNEFLLASQDREERLGSKNQTPKVMIKDIIKTGKNDVNNNNIKGTSIPKLSNNSKQFKKNTDDSDDESLQLDEQLKDLQNIKSNSTQRDQKVVFKSGNKDNEIDNQNDDDGDEDELGQTQIIDNRNRSIPKASMVKVMSDTMIRLKKIYNYDDD